MIIAASRIQVSSAKLNLLQDILEDVLGAGKKVVIFARFIPEIHAIEDVARKIAGDNSYYAITGAVGMEDRGKAVEEFQNNPAVKICIAQIQTAGLGITLTAADTGIFIAWISVMRTMIRRKRGCTESASRTRLLIFICWHKGQSMKSI